jgi:hypothetical protein
MSPQQREYPRQIRIANTAIGALELRLDTHTRLYSDHDYAYGVAMTMMRTEFWPLNPAWCGDPDRPH